MAAGNGSDPAIYANTQITSQPRNKGESMTGGGG